MKVSARKAMNKLTGNGENLFKKKKEKKRKQTKKMLDE